MDTQRARARAIARPRLIFPTCEPPVHVGPQGEPAPMADRWIICASGPSMAGVDMAHLRRFRSWRLMVVNTTWRLAPWGCVLYAGDWQWWREYGADALAFRGQRWTRDERAWRTFSAHRVHGEAGEGLNRTPWHVNIAGNSGYQAINLAYHLGARRIVLLGFDMHRLRGAHWHGDHAGMLSAPEAHIAVWLRAFPALAFDLRAAGVDVVNATVGSALECFRTASVFEALR